MSKYQSLKALLGITIAILVTVWATWHIKEFLPSSNRTGSATAQAVGPVRKTFSSPSEPGADIPQSPVHILSTIDLQRELNRRYPKLKLAEDGVYGPATEAAHVRAIGDQYATELMVREVK